MAVHNEFLQLGLKIANSCLWKSIHSPSCAATSAITHYPIRRNNALFSNLNNRVYSSQDVAPRAIPTSKDLLMQNIKSSADTQSLMHIIKVHHAIMNDKHIMQALRSLFELVKYESSEIDKQSLINSSEFQKLCNTVKQHSRSFEVNETIEALKIVTYLDFPTNSSIVQILLQLVRHNVNELSLQHIVFLDFILKKLHHCPLVDALNIALPIVFEIQLPVKLDRENVVHVTDMLHYAAKNNLSDSTFSTLMGCLTEVCHKLDKKSAENVTWSLLHIKRPVPSVPFVLRQTLNTLSKNLGDFSYDEVHRLLEKLVRNYVKNKDYVYHEEFLDSCASYVVEKQCSLKKTCWILKKLTRIGHTNIKLLDYIGHLVVNDPSALEKAEPNTVIILVSGMSSANYKTEHWDVIEKSIMKNKIMEEDKLELPWIKFALELASLECFHDRLLHRVFQQDFLQKFLAREFNILDHLQLLMLYQGVITLYPTHSGPFPPDDIIKKATEINGDNVSEFPLKGALEHGLGGASYLQTKFSTKLGHFIDHVIVMRKGGFPVAVNQSANDDTSRKFVENLIVPPNSQIILVLALHRGCFTINCNRLRGHFSMMCKGLEALGYAVVPVSLAEWSDIPDHEKIPYLMQTIRLKCDAATSEAAAVQ